MLRISIQQLPLLLRMLQAALLLVQVTIKTLQYTQIRKVLQMAQFKRLVVEVLSLNDAGLTIAEIATRLQCGRSVIEYIIAIYATDHDVEVTWRTTRDPVV